MADYQQGEGGVTRLADGAFIPADPDNRDWQEHLVYLEAGGELLPPPPPMVDEEALELAELRHAAKEKIAEAAGLTPEETEAALGPNGDPLP